MEEEKTNGASSTPTTTHIMEALSDTLMNAFVSPKQVDPRFVDMKEDVKRLEDNWRHAEKLHLRASKLHLGICYL